MTNNQRPASGRTPNNRPPSGRIDKRRNSDSSNRWGRYTPPGLEQPLRPRASCQCPACAPPPCSCSACADERRGIPFDPEREWQRLNDVIERTGMVIEYVSNEPGEVSWAYTIGRLRRNRPELITIGLAPPSAAQMLNEIDATWDELTIPDDGICFVPGKPQHRFAILPVPDALWFSDYLLGAMHDALERDLVNARSALQILWPDDDGRFPWEPGTSSSFRRRQPILGLAD